MARDEFKRLHSSDKCYLALPMPEDPTAQNELRAGLEQLAGDWEGLVVLLLSRDSTVEQLDRRQFGDFNAMLSVAPPRRSAPKPQPGAPRKRQR